MIVSYAKIIRIIILPLIAVQLLLLHSADRSAVFWEVPWEILQRMGMCEHAPDCWLVLFCQVARRSCSHKIH